MPLGMVVYVAPSNAVPGVTQGFSTNAVQVLLVPMNAKNKEGWIPLAPAVLPLPW